MERLKETVVEVAQSILSLVRSTKEAYEGATRFARMRLWVLAILAVDVVVVLVFMTTFGSKAIDVAVWYEPGFPSNLLIVRNESDDVMPEVRLELDGRYGLRVPALAPGVSGFEIGREFTDASELTPEDDYVPKVVVIELDGDSMRLQVGSKPR